MTAMLESSDDCFPKVINGFPRDCEQIERYKTSFYQICIKAGAAEPIPTQFHDIWGTKNRFPGKEFIAYFSEYFQSLLAQEDCSELLSSLALRLAESDSVDPVAILAELSEASGSFDASNEIG
jgi:hypothetical protein